MTASQPLRPDPFADTCQQHKDSVLAALDSIERYARNTRAAILAGQSGVPGILQIGRYQQTAVREAQAVVSFGHAARLAMAVRQAEEDAEAA